MSTGVIKKVCPITGLEITESGKWSNLKLTDNYIISYRKIGDHIVDVHGYGNVGEFDAKRFQSFLDRFIDDQEVVFPYVEMRNYEDLSGILPTRETLHEQKNYFIENKDKRVGFVAYNATKAIGMLLQSGQRQYKRINVQLRTEDSYESAVKSALSILKNHSKGIESKSKKKTYKININEIDQIAMFCGRFLWEENDMFDAEEMNIGPDHPLYSIVENLVIVREELLHLEADSLKKSKALELEKMQTEKIVESLQSGILIVDKDKKRIVDVNPAGCKLLKGTKEQLIGKEFNQFIIDIPVDVYKSHNKSGVRESEIVTLMEEKIPVLRSSVRIKLSGKDYILENLVDISDAKEHEEKLKKSLAHTKQLNNLTFNREKRIIEMKNEVNALLRELGRPPKYKSVLNKNRGIDE
jgi:PAS domain S-box-containing protein